MLHAGKLSADCDEGSFFAPHLFEIDSIEQLPREVFGPVVHLIRYRAADLEHLPRRINAAGYGLTFGIHSRIQGSIDLLAREIAVGNVYVNRNMIGAVVGVQPFGGRGLSGTGPKAGGPLYLGRLLRAVPAQPPAYRPLPEETAGDLPQAFDCSAAGSSGATRITPSSPAIELSRMKAAAIPDITRTSAQRRNSSSGLRKMPPPTPVSPDSRPSAAPQANSSADDGVRSAASGGRLARLSEAQAA